MVGRIRKRPRGPAGQEVEVISLLKIRKPVKGGGPEKGKKN